METISICLILVLLVYLYKFLKIARRKIKFVYRQYEMIKKVPGPPKDSFIFGNIMLSRLSLEGIPDYIKRMLDSNGHAFGLWLPSIPIFITGRAEDAQCFFTSENTNFKADIYHLTRPVLGQGLAVSNGELNQQRRKLISPAFHFSLLTAFCGIFSDNSITLIQKLRAYPPDTTVDVMDIMYSFSLDNIIEAAMGVKMETLNSSSVGFVTAIKNVTLTIIERMTKPWYWNDLLFFSIFSLGREFKRHVETICNFTESVVKAKRKERGRRQTKAGVLICDKDGSVEKRPVFLDLLMDAAEAQSVSLTDQDLKDEVNTFMHAVKYNFPKLTHL